MSGTILNCYDKCNEYSGLTFGFSKIIESKVKRILEKELFWKELSNFDEFTENLKYIRMHPKINLTIDENVLKFIKSSPIFTSNEFEINSNTQDNYILIDTTELFKNKFSTRQFIETFFDHKMKGCFFSSIKENISDRPFVQIILILYLNEVTDLCNDTCVCNNDLKNQCYASYERNLSKLLYQAALILEENIFYPILVDKNIFRQNSLIDLSKLRFESSFEKNLQIFENLIFGNVIFNKELYDQDYLFSFEKGIDSNFLKNLLPYYILKYIASGRMISTKFKGEGPISHNIFDVSSEVIQNFLELRISKFDFSHLLLAYWFFEHEKVITKYSGYDVRFKEFILNLKKIYLTGDINDLWNYFENLDNETRNVLNLFLLNEDINRLLDKKEFSTHTSSTVLAEDLFGTLIKSIHYRKNLDNFQKVPLVFKNIVVRNNLKDVNDFLISEEKVKIEPILKEINAIRILTGAKIDLISVISRWYKIWDKPLPEKIMQFSKTNTMKLLYNNPERFFQVESEINSALAHEHLSGTFEYPSNEDIYYLLKAIITGNKEFAKGAIKFV
ncbi:MAG: hypothetical protein O8C64_03220 [Candidatus Methanoperedens sp.]|nr:hypothetical protein [Candidatus Methanoperedens sp.]MCZ7405751.1 hypothetical protein [Candidatus Methanoperedens sp.]